MCAATVRAQDLNTVQLTTEYCCCAAETLSLQLLSTQGTQLLSSASSGSTAAFTHGLLNTPIAYAGPTAAKRNRPSQLAAAALTQVIGSALSTQHSPTEHIALAIALVL